LVVDSVTRFQNSSSSVCLQPPLPAASPSSFPGSAEFAKESEEDHLLQSEDHAQLFQEQVQCCLTEAFAQNEFFSEIFGLPELVSVRITYLNPLRPTEPEPSKLSFFDPNSAVLWIILGIVSLSLMIPIAILVNVTKRKQSRIAQFRTSSDKAEQNRRLDATVDPGLRFNQIESNQKSTIMIKGSYNFSGLSRSFFASEKNDGVREPFRLTYPGGLELSSNLTANESVENYRLMSVESRPTSQILKAHEESNIVDRNYMLKTNISSKTLDSEKETEASLVSRQVTTSSEVGRHATKESSNGSWLPGIMSG